MVAHSAAPLRTPGLREYQLRVAGALLFGIVERRAPSFTVMFPRQAGKNEVSAVVVAALLRIYSQLGGSIIVCAPTLTPQAAISLDRTWRAAATLARLFAPGARITTEGNRLLAGRASATFLSASPEAHVAGHTASIALNATTRPETWPGAAGSALDPEEMVGEMVAIWLRGMSPAEAAADPETPLA